MNDQNRVPGNSRVPPEPDDEEARRRETLMAYHLGALEDAEANSIRGHIESDPAWKKASEEARVMLDGLEADGAPTAEVPRGWAIERRGVCVAL